MDRRAKSTILASGALLLVLLVASSFALVSAAPGPDLEIRKRATGLPGIRGVVIAGEELIYEIDVYNAGDAATNVVVSDTLPYEVLYLGSNPEVCFLSDFNELGCYLGDMGPGEYREFQIKVLVAPWAVVEGPGFFDGTITMYNHAEVWSEEDDDDPSDNSVDFSIFVEDSADLTVVKMSKPDTHVRAGELFTYTIFVENLGPSVARFVGLRDNILSSGEFDLVGFHSNREESMWCMGTPPGITMTFSCFLEWLEPKGLMPPDAPLEQYLETGQWIINVVLQAKETQDVNNLVEVFPLLEAPGLPIPQEWEWVPTPDPDMSNNMAEDFIYVTDVADLGIEKWWEEAPRDWFEGPPFEFDDCYIYDGPDLVGVRAGCPLRYQIEVSNVGPSLAENVVVEDLLPAGVRVEGVGPSPGSCTTGIPGNPLAPLTCNLGNIENESGAHIEIFVMTDVDLAWEPLENDAWVYSDIFDPDNGNNRSHVLMGVEPFSILYLEKHGPPQILAGQDIEYWINIENRGPSTAHDVYLDDELPGGVSLLGAEVMVGEGSCAPDSALCALGDMLPGQGRGVRVRGYVEPWLEAGTLLTNTVRVWANSPFNQPAPDQPLSATVETEVLVEANLSIVKTSEPMKIYPGEQKMYDIEVTNHGPSMARGIVVTDTLPMEVEYEIDDDGCWLTSEDPDSLECHLGEMMPGETRGFNIWARVRPDAPPIEIVNEAHVFMEPNIDPEDGDNWAWARNLVLDPIFADLEIHKSYDCEGIPDNGVGCIAGAPVTFILDVYNNSGPLTAENAVLEDLLPEGVTVTGYQGWRNDGEWPALSCNTGIPGDPDAPFTCGLGDVHVGDHIQVKIYAGIDPDYVHPTLPDDYRVMENDALVYSDLYDPNNDNNQTSTIFDVYTMSDVYLWKSGPLTALAGEEISYHIRVRNLGPSTLTNFHFVDALPEEEWNGEDPAVTYLGYEIEQGTGECIYPWPMEGDHNVHCYLDDIAPGGVSVVHLRVLVHPDLEDESSIHNEIDGWYANSGHYVDGPMEVDTEIINDADLSIRKEADPYKVYAGEQVRYDISVTNNGPGIAYNVLVSDTLPSGVEFELATIGCSTASPVTGTMLVSTNPGWDSELFSVDLDTVAVTHLGDMQQPLGTDIEYDALSGKLYASMGARWDEDLPAPQLHTVDPETAASLGYVELDEDCAVPALEFVGSTLYATCHVPENGGSHLVTLDPSSGHVFFAPNDTGYERIHGMAYDASAGVMYGVVKEDDENGDEGDLVSINLSTGEASYVCSTGWDNVTGLDYGPGGILYAATGTGVGGEGDLLTIDTDTCDVTVVGDLGMSAAGLTWVAGPELACPLGEIPPGETSTFSIWARVRPDTLGMITNRVDVFSDNDPNPDNNWDTEASLVLGKADLKVTKYGKPDGEVRAGEELEYWVVVDNLGPGFAHDVVLYDLISSDGHFRVWWGEHDRDGDGDGEEYSCQVSGSDCYCWEDGCWCREDAQLTCRLNHPLPVMTPASPGRWLLKVWVEAQEDQSINNLARVVSNDFDPDLSNNEAIAEHEITAVADLDLEKVAWGEVLVGCDETAHWEGEVAAGGELEYTLYIENEGPSDAENVVVEDWGLSPFLDIWDVECEKDDGWRQCSCNLSGLGELGDTDRHFVCYLGKIDDDDRDMITIRARIPSDVPEGTRLVNDARVYSDVFDDDNGDNLDYNWTYVIATADLGVEKSQEPETTLPGLEVVYTIRVDNWGPSDAHGVLISDTLPFTPTTMTVEGCASDGGQCDVPCEVPTCPAGECPWPDVDFVAQADIPAGEHVIYTLTAIPEWVPCEPITNTAQVGFAPGFDDIDPCDCEECDGKDFAYTVSDPECNFVPLVLKSFPGPDSPL